MHQTAHPRPFRDALRRLIAEIDLVFCKMTRIQFSAPWRRDIGSC